MAINMQHCMFENTFKALKECENTLANTEGLEIFSNLSESEQKYAKKLLRLCYSLSDDFEGEY